MIRKLFVNNKTLTWIDDEKTDNNLYIEKLWNMKDTVGFDDYCENVEIVDDNRFYFWTFKCMKYEMQISGDKVECVSKVFTK